MNKLIEKPDHQQKQEKDFAELFGPLIKHIRKIKRLGHIASFSTQAFAIYQISQSSFSGLAKGYLITLSLFLAIAIGVFIEGGISSIFPIWARQVIRWKFQSKWYGIMFAVITVIVIPLVIFSPALSGAGAAESVEQITPEVNRSATDQLELAYNSRVDSVKMDFNTQIAAQNKLYNDRISSAKAKYQRLIYIQNGSYNKHKKLKEGGAPWAQSHMDKATNEVTMIKAQREEELDLIRQQKLEAIERTHQAELAMVSSIDTDKKRELSHIDSDFEAATVKRTSFVLTWKNIGWYFAVFASIIVIICILITEVYRRGAGQEYQKYIDEENSSPFDQLLTAIDDRVDGFISKLTKGVVNGVEIDKTGPQMLSAIPLPRMKIKGEKAVDQLDDQVVDQVENNGDKNQLGYSRKPMADQGSTKLANLVNDQLGKVVYVGQERLFQHENGAKEIVEYDANSVRGFYNKYQVKAAASKEKLNEAIGKGDTRLISIHQKALANRQRWVEYWATALEMITKD